MNFLGTSSRASGTMARPLRSLVVRAAAEGDKPKAQRRRRPKAPQPQESAGIELNPIELGRKSRQIFDDVWSRFSTLGMISRGTSYDDDFDDFRDENRKEFDTPQSRYTTVLVVGATGRVGRVLLRKLLLRGYAVKALVKPGSPGLDLIPRKVDVVEGDVSDKVACRKAVEGVTKVVYCAGVAFSAPLDKQQAVYELGVENVLSAFLDEIQRRRARKDAVPSVATPKQLGKKNVANFSREKDRAAWKVVEVEARELAVAGRPSSKGTPKETSLSFTNDGSLKFTGTLYSRGSAAKIGADLEPGILSESDSLLLRVKGDGNTYSAVVKSRNGQLYSSRFVAKKGYSSVKLPISSFKNQDGRGLKPQDAIFLGLRFDYKTGKGTVLDVTEAASKFGLEVEWIKTTPKGEETDFILVSCAGAAQRRAAAAMANGNGNGASTSAPSSSLIDGEAAKSRRRGEEAVRNSGLGYTIVRPGLLVEESGGYRALVFDQGNRITQSISCADVADVCLRSMHEPAARNIMFEVCYEYTAEEKGEAGLYELVAHLPKKSTNYLALGLSSLEQS